MPAVTTATPSCAIAPRLGAAPPARAPRDFPDARAPEIFRGGVRVVRLRRGRARVRARASDPPRRRRLSRGRGRGGPTPASPRASARRPLDRRRQLRRRAPRASPRRGGRRARQLDGIMADIREEEAKLKALRFEREAESARAINAVREAEEQKARQQVVDGKTLCIHRSASTSSASPRRWRSSARSAQDSPRTRVRRRLPNSTRSFAPSTRPSARRFVTSPIPDAENTIVHPAGRGLRRSATAGQHGPRRRSRAVGARRGGGGRRGRRRRAVPRGIRIRGDDEIRASRGSRASQGGDGGCARAREKFEKALMLSRMVGDQVQVRRAVRGLSASERGLGRGKEAIAHLKEVLEISKQIGDFAGDAARRAPSPTSTPNPAIWKTRESTTTSTSRRAQRRTQRLMSGV